MTNELVIATNVVSREITGLDIVNSVNGFYSGAFDKLFQLVLALIALFGVIIPILVQIYQRRVMKVSESELKAEMAKLLEEKKKELLVEIENKLKSEKEQIAESLKNNTVLIDKRLDDANGAILHVQGNMNIRANQYIDACQDFCGAGELYCQSKSGRDLGAVLESLSALTLPNVTKNDLESRGLNKRLEELIKKIRKTDTDRFLARNLEKLEAALIEARTR